MSNNQNAKKLLLDICNCPNVKIAADDKSHPCHKIVVLQNECPPDKRQLPEPWSGDIVNAPLLIVSSNPSISEAEHYPTSRWSDDKIADFFTNRFSGRWTDKLKTLCADEKSYSKRPVMFWCCIRKQAERAFGRQVKAGQDYAITEVVHCKSTGEKGVRKSMNECGDKWTKKIIAMSKARVIMVVGAVARDWFSEHYGIDRTNPFHTLQTIAGKKRTVLIVPHPSGRKPKNLPKGQKWGKTLDKILTKEQLNHINAILSN